MIVVSVNGIVFLIPKDTANYARKAYFEENIRITL